MPDFGSPFKGNSLGRKLTGAELVRAMRFVIAAEYEAIQLYHQIAEATDNEFAAKVLNDVADEEVVHAGEFLAVLKELDPKEAKLYKKGMDEVDELKAKASATLTRIVRGRSTMKRKALVRHLLSVASELENRSVTAVKVNPRDKKELQSYAEEIARNLMKEHPDATEDQLRRAVHTVMMNMVLDESNPNYRNTKKYMPKKFNKVLFDNGDNNAYDSVWMNQNDTQKDTIIRKALKKVM